MLARKNALFNVQMVASFLEEIRKVDLIKEIQCISMENKRFVQLLTHRLWAIVDES